MLNQSSSFVTLQQQVDMLGTNGGGGTAQTPSYMPNTIYTSGQLINYAPNGYVHLFYVPNTFTSTNAIQDSTSGNLIWQSGCDMTFTLGGTYLKGMWLNYNLTIYKCLTSYTNNSTNTFQQDKNDTTSKFGLVTFEFQDTYITEGLGDSKGISLTGTRLLIGSTTNGSNVIPISNFLGVDYTRILIGMSVTSTDIPSNTTISDVNSSYITISSNATNTNSNSNLVINFWLSGQIIRDGRKGNRSFGENYIYECIFSNETYINSIWIRYQRFLS
jgi:hypothetical protein